MIDVIKEILNYLLSNYALYLVVTMGIIISLTISILSLIKKPIKKLTSKISNDTLRKLVNKMFIIFAFAISAGAWFVLNIVSPAYFPIKELEILLTGAFSIVIYALGDGIINKSSAEKLIEQIKEIEGEDKTDTEENKKQSVDPIKSFWDKVK